MKKLSTLLFLPILTLIGCQKKQANYTSYENYPVYADANLWVEYSPESTKFALWSPLAEKVKVNLYEKGNGGNSYASYSLEEEQTGLWGTSVGDNLKGVYYTYQVKIKGTWLDETPGIYAQAVGVNGHRAMVVDLSETDPEGWDEDQRVTLEKPNQAIIYELHVRDITTHPSSGSSFPGKFLGLIEPGTKGPGGIKTAIDHMKELGITHVHLLPSYDNYSIDESRLDVPQFNWGYDPQNYNVPEGSFSRDPFHAEVRINEFKRMVKAFHENGIGVILDVVYNHTGRTDESAFNLESPGYYYRHRDDGSWSDAAACGNETASERIMMRKFMLESVLYWAKEYHLDGFRFDLMGIHDIETMNLIATELKEYNPNIMVYGEGWTAGDSPLPVKDRALKKHTFRMPGISAFSDDIRDGLKGSVFEDDEGGFVSGTPRLEESVKFGVVGSIDHPTVNSKAVNYSDTAWANHPWQAVSYVSCHDNHTLFDKLTISAKEATPQQITAMHKLANAIVLTSQGIPFLHAGVELKRTKGGEHNSYNLPDSVNQINWNWKSKNKDVFEYYRNLIGFRKSHPAFAMPTGDMVRENLVFLPEQEDFVGYTISNHANDDKWDKIMVLYNARTSPLPVELDGSWQIAVMGDEFDEEGKASVTGKVKVPPISMAILFKK